MIQLESFNIQVLEVLKGLEILAGKLNKLVVVFIDEFQRVLETERGSAIQGAIRSIAQTKAYGYGTSTRLSHAWYQWDAKRMKQWSA